MTRDLRDELPPLLRAWWAWNDAGLTHWRSLGTLVHLALMRGFVPLMLAVLGAAVALLFSCAAVPCYVAHAIVTRVRPSGAVVVFRRENVR
jgi:hypothetical protein